MWDDVHGDVLHVGVDAHGGFMCMGVDAHRGCCAWRV